jgi:hypothetical protein
MGISGNLQPFKMDPGPVIPDASGTGVTGEEGGMDLGSFPGVTGEEG